MYGVCMDMCFHVCTCMWWSKVDSGLFLKNSSPPYRLKQGLLVNPILLWLGRLVSLLWNPHPYLLPAGIADRLTCPPGFYVGSGDSKSTPHLPTHWAISPDCGGAGNNTLSLFFLGGGKSLIFNNSIEFWDLGYFHINF